MAPKVGGRERGYSPIRASSSFSPPAAAGALVVLPPLSFSCRGREKILRRRTRICRTPPSAERSFAAGLQPRHEFPARWKERKKKNLISISTAKHNQILENDFSNSWFPKTIWEPLELFFFLRERVAVYWKKRRKQVGKKDANKL